MLVVDFAWTKPTVAQLKSWGAVAVGMYVSNDNTKNANRSLISAYAQASIKTFLFFEDSATNAVRGYSQGHTDATFALGWVQINLDMPSWAPIIVAIDMDAPDYAPTSNDPAAKLGPIGDYLRAWNAVMGSERVGVYGDYYVCQRAIAAGFAKYAIQTVAWSGGKVDLHDIATYQNGVMLDGGNVDVELIESQQLLDKIAWYPGEPSPISSSPKPITPKWEERKMLHLKVTAPANSGVPWEGKTQTYLYAVGTAPVHIVDETSELAIAGFLPAVDISWSQFTALGGH
jgi:glycoside hydrolase-like protein